MNLQRASLVAVLLAALLNGGAAFADPPTEAPPATPAAQPAIEASAPAPTATPPTQTPPALQTATGPMPSTPVARAATPVAVGSSASSMLSGLLFLVVLVLGAAWLIRRTGGMPALRGNASMKVVAAMSLGPRERVVLIELGGQQWLLGVGGGSVNMLHHFEQPIVVGGNDDFAGRLRQLWPQGAGPLGRDK